MPLLRVSSSSPSAGRPGLGILGAVLVLSLAAGSPAAARQALPDTAVATTPALYTEADTIGEVISSWNPETHLYVMGNVGLDDDRLAELAAWLGDRHWTVLLVQDASGQTWVDAEGRTHQGEDAIDYGAGQGITAKLGFAELRHPLTGEPDGTIFTIVLAQRALFYTASTAQDNRLLGDYNFQGHLDQWAIAALRDGGDLVGAVRETVTQIDALVGEAIARERASTAHELERLAEAQSHLTVAEHAVTRARNMVAFRRFLILMAGLAALALGVWLSRRRRGAKLEAEELLAAWRGALDAKLSALVDELERRVARLVGPLTGEGTRVHTGETRRLADQVRADVGSLFILWTSANVVLEKARALVEPALPGALFNFFFAGSYRKALALLRDEPVPFDPVEGLPRLFGRERTWRDDLLGVLASYEPFRKSFTELVAEFDLRAGRAAGALDLIEESQVGVMPALSAVEARIERTAARRGDLASAGAADGRFLVPALVAATLPAAATALGQAREAAPTDPVGALQGPGAAAERITRDAERIVEVAATARAGTVPAVATASAALAAARLPTSWIASELDSLSGRVDLLATRAAGEDVAGEVEGLGAEVAALRARAERTAALLAVLGRVRTGIEAASNLVEGARRELGSALGLAPERILREQGEDPTERLAAATERTEATAAALGRGELEDAEAALAAATRLSGEAAAIVEASRRAFAAQEATVRQRRAETARIEGLLPEHERILDRLRREFAASVLALRADDPDHPGANGTVADNLEEAREHLAAAHRKLAGAESAFPAGGLLAAAELLRQVGAHQELAVHRLQEVAEREARLDRTLAGNATLLPALAARVRADEASIAADPRITVPTLAALAAATQRLEAARAAAAFAQGDPLAVADELAGTGAALDSIEGEMARRDRELHAEALRSAEAAARELATADDLARRAAGDGIADSTETLAARSELEQLSAAQDRAGQALGLPHGDWAALDAETDRIAARAAILAATLQHEIARAEAAAAAVAAEEARRQAAAWHAAEERRRRAVWSSSGSSRGSSSSGGGGSSGSSGSSGGGSGSGRSSWGGSSSGSGRSSWGGSRSGSGKSRW